MATASTSALASTMNSTLAASRTTPSVTRKIVIPHRSRSSVVDRFIAREARLKQRIEQSPGGVATLRSLAGGVNPQATVMFKHPLTGRWIPPRLSIRAQADLGKAAYREGRFDELLQAFKTFDLKLGSKLRQLQTRIVAGQNAQELSDSLVNSPALAILAERSTTLRPEQAKRNALAAAKQFAVGHGPYSGRSRRNLFKGTKAERDAPARKRAIVEKLGKMDTTITTWRQARRDAKIKAQPKLPF
jgi:hypothetical protein